MKDLKASFEKALNTIREVKKIRDPIEYLTANMNRFLDFITQCSIFIQGYVQHTFLGTSYQNIEIEINSDYINRTSCSVEEKGRN